MEEDEEITQKDIEAKNNKEFMKMMEVLLWEGKERYLLKLAQQWANYLANYNVKTLITKEEETKNLKLQTQVQTMQDQIIQLIKDKDKPTT